MFVMKINTESEPRPIRWASASIYLIRIPHVSLHSRYPTYYILSDPIPLTTYNYSPLLLLSSINSIFIGRLELYWLIMACT